MKKLIIAMLLCASTASAGWFPWISQWVQGQQGWTYLRSAMTLTPSFHSYSSINVGAHADYSFTVKSTGNDLLEAAVLGVAGSSFAINSTTCGSNPFNLSAGTTCSVVVRAAPAGSGTQTGTLTVTAPNLTTLTSNLSVIGVSSGDTAPSGSIVFWKADSTTLDMFNSVDGSAVTLVGSPSFVPGHSGNGLQINANNQYARFVATHGHSINASFFIEFWFKSLQNGIGGNPSARLFSHDSQDDGLGLYYRNSTDAAFVYNGVEYDVSTANIYDQAFHKVHITGVSGGTGSITVDANSPVTFSMATSGTFAFTGNMWIGNRPSDGLRPAMGIIDSFAIGQ